VHEEMDQEREECVFANSTHLLLQNEIHMSSTYYAIHNSVKATIIMNPSPLPSEEQIREFPWDRIHWLIVNEAEAEGLYHSIAEASSPGRKGLSTKELVFGLSAQPALKDTNIICTLGSDGVLAFIPTFHRPKTAHEAPSFMHLPAARLMGDVKDTTGAGDCFTGYFVQGLMEYGPRGKVGEDIRENDVARILKICVYVGFCDISFWEFEAQFFMQAAGMCVEKRGTIDSIPTKAEVETRMLTTG
jgi:ribokinase